MAAYKLLIKPSAAKEIEAVGAKADRRRIVDRIMALAANPRPVGNEKLAGRDGHHRVRQGDFRIVYSVDDVQELIVVI